MTRDELQRMMRDAHTRAQLVACNEAIAAWLRDTPDDHVVREEAESVEMALSALDLIETHNSSPSVMSSLDTDAGSAVD